KGQAWGLWSILMGHVDGGETTEEAAKREVKEEAGYDIEIIGDLGKKIVSDTEYKGGEKDKGKEIEITFFKGNIVSGKLKPDLEVLLDVKWVDKNKVLSLPLRGGWLKDFIK
ncbi:MAG TPA: NUDIX hydrolase, partial [Candidatus Nanoarchaeia archaeon]